MPQTFTRYLAIQVLPSLASDAALLGVSAILAIAAISSAAIMRGMDGILVASAFSTIVSTLNIIVLKRVSQKKSSSTVTKSKRRKR